MARRERKPKSPEAASIRANRSRKTIAKQSKAKNDLPNPLAEITRRRRVLGYIRLTRDESLKVGLSALAQRNELIAYASRLGRDDLEILEELEPTGGDVPFEDRTAGSLLIAAVASGDVSDVVVRDIDRLVRSDRLWLQFRDLSLKNGVTLHTLSGPVPLNSPSDLFASNIKVAAAMYERDQAAHRGKLAKREAARQGRHIGGPPVFGYTSQARYFRELVDAGQSPEDARLAAETKFPHRGVIFKDPAEAKIVTAIFRLYVRDRKGCRTISDWLNQRGYRRRSGKPWHPDKVRRLLCDPTVAGFIAYDEEHFQQPHGPHTPKAEQVLFKGRHQAIVDEATWREAQAIRQSRRNEATGRGNSGPSNRRYALSGVMRCLCGKPMHIASNQRKRGYAYYCCRARRDYGPDGVGGCDAPRVSMAKADEAVWNTISALIATPEVVDAVHEAAWRNLQEHCRQSQDDLQAVKRVKKLKADLGKWYERHDAAETDVEKEAAWQRIVELTKNVRDLESLAIAEQLQPSELPIVTKDAVKAFLADLVGAMPSTPDRGAGVIQALVADHQLQVQLLDGETLSVSMAIQPFSSVLKGHKHRVSVERNASLPKGRIDAWLDENIGKHRCGICGEVVDVVRRHFWTGIPQFHRNCHVGQMAKRKNPDPAKLYTGAEAARRLKVSRTEFGRWMKSGKVRPFKRKSNVLLFRRAHIDKLADQAV